MRRYVTLLAAFACGTTGLIFATGGASSASSYPAIPKGPIVLGVSTPLSGPSAADGISTEESFKNVTFKYFDQENPNGVDGHQFTLDFQNDQGTVNGAAAAANQLVADHVSAVITATYNPEAIGVQMAIFAKAKIPVIGVETELPQYTNAKAYPYFFSTGPSDPEEAAATEKFIAKKGYTRIATLSTGIPSDQTALDEIVADTKKSDPKAKVVKSVTIPPGSVDDAAAITELKAANPQVLISYLGVGYGSVWQAMQAANWSPDIITDAGVWYDEFSAMGALANKAYAPYNDCVNSVTQTFPANVETLMGEYSAATDAYSTNYLTYIATDQIPLEFMKYAVEKEHSVAPQAIQAALEGMHNKSFFGVEYNFSPTNHFGETGEYSAAVCNVAAPYAGGVGKVPVKA